MKSKNLLFLYSVTFLLFSCGNNKSSNKNGSYSSNVIYSEMWHLKNTGQNSYSSSKAKSEIDLNIDKSEQTGKNVNVLVADHAAELTHRDLAPNVKKGGSIDLFSSSPSGVDSLKIHILDSEHGTNVSGIIGGAKNSTNGFQGVAPNVKIGTAKYLSDTDPAVSRALKYFHLLEFAFNNNFQIINQSFGTRSFSYPAIEDNNSLINDLIKNKIKTKNNGVVIVKSAGNEGYDFTYADKYNKHLTYDLLVNMTESRVLSIAGASDINSIMAQKYLTRVRSIQSSFDDLNSNPYIIAVAAASSHGIATDYSSVGSNLWITAFGGDNDSAKTNDNIYSLSFDVNPAIITTKSPILPISKSRRDFDKNDTKYPENRGYYYTASFNGTSAAAPMVSGIIALMLEANPQLTVWDVKYILAKTARKDILVANPKPFCVKVLEKLNIFNSANNYWEPWNKSWTSNAAGNSFHHVYGFGLIDGKAAVKMAKNFKSPYDGKTIDSEEVKNFLVNKDVTDGNQDDTTSIVVTKDIIIQAINIFPVLNTTKADGISVELISPNGTVSTILYPGNALIPESNTTTSLAYPGNSELSSIGRIGFLANNFYEENAKGTWKLRIKNGNKTGDKVTIVGYRMNILGFPK